MEIVRRPDGPPPVEGPELVMVRALLHTTGRIICDGKVLGELDDMSDMLWIKQDDK
ncbi:MAG: hypothetical protein IKE61_02990 [Coriobacteriales bacterium]|nr:hypothetical protein [Coriobacteriales bacterium]